MKIAVIGAGISGLVSAYLLREKYDITVFEANDYIGGHTHTVPVERGGRHYAVDTGFIVFNEENYPNFVKLLKRLDVASQPSNMSFGVRCDRSGIEYCGSSLNQLFAQRGNLLKPSHYRMILDIRRFHGDFPRILAESEDGETLEAYVSARNYSQAFVDRFLVPMGSAIWSADPEQMMDFPLRCFVKFFDHHRFLERRNQPKWRVIQGGSHAYVEKLIAPFRDRIRVSTPVESVRRHEDHVEITPRGQAPERFDQVVLAVHSDQALGMLADAADNERRILSAIGYQANDTLLHIDTSVLPRNRRAWASWNYRVPARTQSSAVVTYNMNKLQSLDSPETFCVTLNGTNSISDESHLLRQTYHHPVYTPEALAVQKEWDHISGVRRTHYCGAYWGYGFHEDGVNSALAVCGSFGIGL